MCKEFSVVRKQDTLPAVSLHTLHHDHHPDVFFIAGFIAYNTTWVRHCQDNIVLLHSGNVHCAINMLAEMNGKLDEW